MKIKKIINIVIVLIFLATIAYAEDNLCENKPNPCFKGLEGVDDKINKLKGLEVGETNYKELQEQSEDITVSIESLYEEASMYKNLALLRTQIEGLPKEVLKELEEKKVGVAKKKKKDKAKKEDTTSPTEEPVATEPVATEPAATEPAQEVTPTKGIVIDGIGPINIRIWFYNGKWEWCKTEYILNNCKSEKYLTSKEISKDNPSEKEKIGFDTKTYYKILSNLIAKDYKNGLDETVYKLIIFKVLEDKDLNLKIGGTRVSFDKKYDIVTIKIDKEYNAIKIKYKATIGSSGGKEIDVLQKLEDYDKALKKIQKLQTKY